MDTQDVHHVLKTLVQKVGSQCLVGVGTIMHKDQVKEIAQLGARFALSPINPPGFIQECLAYGIIPVPAAFTPNEVFSMYLDGAPIIKLFPAQLWNPAKLKALKGVGRFAEVPIAPSGGVSPENFQEWLAAGACAVGMGSNLAGKEISTSPGTAEFSKAKLDWETRGRASAAGVFAKLKKMRSSL